MQWAISDWHPMTFAEIRKCNTYLITILETYFSYRGYTLTGDGDAINTASGEYFHYSSFGGVMSLQYFEKDNMGNTLALFSFYEYPSSTDKFFATVHTPSPRWAVGFLEKFFITFERALLPIIREKRERYQILLAENKKIAESCKLNCEFPIIDEMTAKWYEENRQINMPIRYLSPIPEGRQLIKKKLVSLITAATN